MALRPGAVLLLITLGHLLKLLTAETQCENIYQDFSGCILKLGENMARYEEEAEEDKVNRQSLLQGLQVVCGYWNEFHNCVMATLWVCQKEMVTVWEKLKKESRKIKFEGNLFDLCISNNYQNLPSSQVPTLFLLSITLMLIWLNL
ncbi:neuritin-like [Pseudonaja textilis]|uniref:neuritin-like n=1 Tax=Pseudonaja textilis TaxID=8673 RepID=UPI000EAA8177|nr:neuritin-like [Pseudonaja textilis]